jgi:biopolymer transport protein ExbD
MSAATVDEEREISEINMTPFVDIVLVILVIFMATATFVAEGKIPVTLPNASVAPEPSPHPPAVLTIEHNGRYYLDGEALSEAALGARLAALDASVRDAGVELRSDARTPFDYVVKAIDLCKQGGITKFAIKTREVK